MKRKTRPSLARSLASRSSNLTKKKKIRGKNSGLNVSATHSIIAGIMGFSLVWGGVKGVNWASPAKGQIPPFSGVVPIVVSWFASPIVTGCLSALLFMLLRTLVLRRKNALLKSLLVLPFAVALTLFINIYFVFTKGAKKMLASSSKDWSDGKAAWISAVIAGVAALLTALIIVPLLHRRIKTFFDADGNAIAGRETNRGDVNSKGKDNDVEGKTGALALRNGAAGADGNPTNAADVLERISQMPGSAIELAWHKRAWNKVVDLSTTGVKYDIHEHGVKDDPMVAAIHANGAIFFFTFEERGGVGVGGGEGGRNSLALSLFSLPLRFFNNNSLSDCSRDLPLRGRVRLRLPAGLLRDRRHLCPRQ